MDAEQDRGLLDLSVELSTRELMAGKEFAVFVLVKNPFSRPVWVQRVHVSLPRELELAGMKQAQKETEQAETKLQATEQAKQEQRKALLDKVDAVQEQVKHLGAKLSQPSPATDELVRLLHDVEFKVDRVRDDFEKLDAQTATLAISGSTSAGDIKIGSPVARLQIETSDTDEPVSIGNIEIDSRMSRLEIDSRTSKGRTSIGNIHIQEPWQVQGKARQVELESSLPDGVALQPGNTAVYTVILNIKEPLMFRPSQYRLHFNVNYSFERPAPQPQDGTERSREEKALFTNTVSYEFSIRASVYSVIAGSALGGFIGSVGRMLQTVEPTKLFEPANWLALAVAIILSVMAIVFMARKSESQSFLSVEDFWGGLLVGFLVGYGGTSFFKSITGVSSLSVPTP